MRPSRRNGQSHAARTRENVGEHRGRVAGSPSAGAAGHAFLSASAALTGCGFAREQRAVNRKQARCLFSACPRARQRVFDRGADLLAGRDCGHADRPWRRNHRGKFKTLVAAEDANIAGSRSSY